jgi:hypothetical protein
VGTRLDLFAVIRFLSQQRGAARRMAARVASLALVAMMLGVPLAGPVRVVHAANVVVTSDADSGTGSLRDSISAAGPGGTITFDPSMAGASILLQSELAINKSVTIENTTGGTIAIDGQGQARVLHITGGTVTIRGGSEPIYITNGNIQDGSGGGGVRIESSGTLNLERVVVSNSLASGSHGAGSLTVSTATGGGNPGTGAGISNAGTLNLRQCLISDNHATGGNGGSGLDGDTGDLWQAGGGGGAGLGGGLFNEGTVNIVNCTFLRNVAMGGFGGVGNAGGGGGAGIGGGIFQRAGTLLATNVTLSGNVAVGGQGVPKQPGSTHAPLATSGSPGTFGQGGQGASRGGDGGFGAGGGGGVSGSVGAGGGDGGSGSVGPAGGNGGFGGGGGGILLGTPGMGGTGGGNGASDNVLSGTTGGGGGGGGIGGAMFVYGGTAGLASSTLSNNSTQEGGTLQSTAGPGEALTAGIWVSNGTGGSLAMRASIVGGNTGGAHPDLEGGFVSGGYNLLHVSTGGTGYVKTDHKDVDPKLGVATLSLPNFIPFHPLLSGSPAIDGGPKLGCTDASGSPLTYDQRLVTRPHDGDGDGNAVCDVGAYEAAPLALQTTASPFTFTENGPIMSIDLGLSLSGPDGAGALMFGATVKITTGYVEGQDSLGFLAPISSPIASAGFDGPSGALTLTGWASPAQYEAALRSVLYNNLSHPPSTAPRIVTFEVRDPIYGVVTSTRQINVVAANKAPTASADSYSTTQPNVLTVPAPGVLANDADPDTGPSPLTAAKVSGPGHGTLSLDASGGFSYTPAGGFVGTDTFAYQVSDGQATSAPATVTIVVNAPGAPVGPGTPNRAPVAVADTYSLVHPNVLTVAAPGVLANDADPDASPGPLTAVKASGPSHGALDLQANGGFSYRPSPDFAGTDSFTYQARDGESLSPPVTVTIAVAATACSPRPKVTTSTTPGGGKLVVQVESTALSTAGVNPLQQVKFGTLQNARVTMSGQGAPGTQSVSSDQAVVFPASTTTATFTVERAAPGQPTTVPFTVVDGCGEWKSFVGGGAAAGF